MTQAISDALALVELLRDLDIPATADVRSAVAMLPCVLIPPPAIESTTMEGRTYRWRLIVLAADASGSLHSWEQLDGLLDALWDALPVERADPISYNLPAAGSDPLPAYVVTLTGSD